MLVDVDLDVDDMVSYMLGEKEEEWSNLSENPQTLTWQVGNKHIISFLG